MPFSSAAAATTRTGCPAATLLAALVSVTEGGESSKPEPKPTKTPPPQPCSASTTAARSLRGTAAQTPGASADRCDPIHAGMGPCYAGRFTPPSGLTRIRLDEADSTHAAAGPASHRRRPDARLGHRRRGRLRAALRAPPGEPVPLRSAPARPRA